MTPRSSPPVGGGGITLVLPRGFFDAFPPGLSEESIRASLDRLGFPRLREVGPQLGPYLEALLREGRPGHPAVSSACPPANAWLATRSPRLAAGLVDLPSPAEEAILEAAGEAAASAAAAGGSKLLFVSPCEAKRRAMEDLFVSLHAEGIFVDLRFESRDLGEVRAAVLAELGLPSESPARGEAEPRLPPGIRFVEGEEGLARLDAEALPPDLLAVLPFWCVGGCGGQTSD